MKPVDCLKVYEDAEFYDIEFAARDHEIPFFRRHSQRAAGPVLEVACGTGRITLPIARDGIEIAGLDISAPMIDRARRHAEAAGLQVNWHVQDCRDIRLDTQFGLIFSATNAMQHLLDVESVCAFLQSARNALSPGGRLILDVFNPDLAKLMRDPSDRHHHKTITLPDGKSVVVEAASSYQSDSQILHFDLFYLQNARLLRTKHVNMRIFFPEELLALCELNGIRVLDRYGDYDESPFSAGSLKQILICRS